jgi:plastocyanin
MKRFGLFWAGLCLVAAFVTACGGSSNSSYESPSGTATATASASEATSAPAPAGAATMTIKEMNFGESITVPPGAQITIKNDDSAEHSVTSDAAGKFDVEVDGTEQGTLTAPSEPGEYAFHCKYHPSMHGTLIVK